MKAEQVVNSIRMFLAIIVLCGGCFFIFNFFSNIREGIRLVDWLFLLAGICFVAQGGIYINTALKKRKGKEKEKNKEL